MRSTHDGVQLTFQGLQLAVCAVSGLTATCQVVLAQQLRQQVNTKAAKPQPSGSTDARSGLIGRLGMSGLV